MHSAQYIGNVLYAVDIRLKRDGYILRGIGAIAYATNQGIGVIDRCINKNYFDGARWCRIICQTVCDQASQ